MAVRHWAAIAAAIAMLTAASCSQEGMQTEAVAPAAPPPMEESAAGGRGAVSSDAAYDAEKAEQSVSSSAGQSGAPAPIAYLAYAYALGLEVPGARLISLMDAHAAACQSAGARLCQLIGANRDGDPDAYITGSLSLRAEPGWLRTFMSGVASDADTAGGRVTAQSTSTEDLTRAIIDTEATLRAKKALRDRLQALLESRPGRLADLLEVERELARVQGEIDATESNLAAMRTRVSMSALTIQYQSAPRSVASDTFEPLSRAVAGFIGYLVQGVAAIITLTALLLPWAALIALLVWVLALVRKRRGGRLLPRRAKREGESAT